MRVDYVIVHLPLRIDFKQYSIVLMIRMDDIAVEYNMLNEFIESHSSMVKFKIFAITQSSQILCLFLLIFYKQMDNVLCKSFYVSMFTLQKAYFIHVWQSYFSIAIMFLYWTYWVFTSFWEYKKTKGRCIATQ